jgi:hypothetical protein
MKSASVIKRGDFDELLTALARRGYTIVGPTVRDRAIVFDEISSAAELPIGLTDEQEAGTYRLRRRDDEALFGYAVGPHSWKQYQLPAELRLWRASVDDSGALTTEQERPSAPPKYAFLGARSCDLHARGILDHVLLGGRHSDPGDASRTEDAFVVAVQCGEAGGTCFCVSMGTGPVAERGFDLALTEILTADEHHFVVEVGSDRGADVLAEVQHRAATPSDDADAGSVHTRTAEKHGPKARYDRHQGPAVPQLREPAVGRGGRALPHVWQLHDGLSYVLLHDRRGRHRPRRAARRAPSTLGLLLHGRLFAHPWRRGPRHGTIALPTVDDAQAGDLVGPVRLLRLRRLRALHHMMPGGDRPHRGGERDSGE